MLHISHERLRTSDPPRRRLGAARDAHSTITITEGSKRPKFDPVRSRRVSAHDGHPTGPARSAQPSRPSNRSDHPPPLAHPPRRQPFGPLSGLPASSAAGRRRLDDGGDDPRRIFCCGGATHDGDRFAATGAAMAWPRRGRRGPAASQKGVTNWVHFTRAARPTNEWWKAAPLETSRE